MKVHVYDFRWRDEQSVEFQASSGEKFGRKLLQVGSPLSVAIASEPRCAGSRVDGVWRPCPEGNTGRAKCETCRARERNFVYTAFDGFNRDNFTDSDLACIAGEHLVYLALFDTDLLKVGVCNATRKTMRQLEQGSHFTLFIAKTPDGILARQIETLIRRNGLADKIKPSQKKDFLCPEVTAEEGEQILRETFTKHKTALSDHEKLQQFLLSEPEFVNWKAHYHLHSIEDSPKGFHSVTLGNDESLSGTIVAVKGPFLVVETPDELVSICAKDLYGRDVDFAEKPAGLKTQAAFQSALF